MGAALPPPGIYPSLGRPMSKAQGAPPAPRTCECPCGAQDTGLRHRWQPLGSRRATPRWAEV